MPPAPAADPTKVTGRRILAFLIDAFIGGLVVFVAAATTFTNTEFPNSIAAEDQCDAINNVSDDVCIQFDTTLFVGTGGDAALVVLTWIAMSVLLTMLIPAFTGWSPGKLVVGLRIVKQDTFELAGVGPNLLRGLLWVVDGFVCGPLVGGIAMVSTDGNRRIGDMAAKTFVVRADQVGHPVPVGTVNTVASAPVFAAATAPPPPSGPPAGIPATSPPPPTGPPAGAAPVTPPPPSTPPVTPVASSSPPPPAAAAPPVFPPPTPGDPPPPTGPLHEHQPPPPGTPEPGVVHDATPEPEPAVPEPTPSPTPPEPEAAEPVMPTEPPAPAPRPGVDAPMWDDARDTYIQWDPELDAWMMWSEAGGRWVPISR